MQVRYSIAVALGVAVIALPAPADEETDRAIASIKAVAREGKGNDDASPAWKTLVSKGGSALMPTLEAFDDSNPTASNWLRAAVDAMIESEKAAGRSLPAEKLEAFATNTKLAASGRVVAYELLSVQDPSAKARLLPTFLNDKSPDLRREAIEYTLEKLETAKPPSLKAELEKLFTFARDKDQVDSIAKKLEMLGSKVSVTEHFAFLTHFSLIGPFDSTGGKGFMTSYPPEKAKAQDSLALYTGKGDAKLSWKATETTDKYGTFDINKLLEKHKEAVAYAHAVLVAEKETPCEIRVASPNAIQIFLNGKKLFEREEYHHGSALDANIGKGILNKGENVIVLKVCQNNQSEPWAQSWQFQLRVCDATGGPLDGVMQKLPGNDKLTKLGTIVETSDTKEEKK